MQSTSGIDLGPWQAFFLTASVDVRLKLCYLAGRMANISKIVMYCQLCIEKLLQVMYRQYCIVTICMGLLC